MLSEIEKNRSMIVELLGRIQTALPRHLPVYEIEEVDLQLLEKILKEIVDAPSRRI